jgi:hypothetical protein
VGAVKLQGIKVAGMRVTKAGKLEVKKQYASVSDRLKRGDKRRIVRGKRI